MRKERKDLIDIEKLETKHEEESAEIFKQEKGNNKRLTVMEEYEDKYVQVPT